MGGAIRFYLGILAATLMVLLCGYSLRKRWAPLANYFSLNQWLNAHITLGIIASLLAFIHAQFQSHGISSLTLYSLSVVLASGLIGKFLMAKISHGRESLAMGMYERQKKLEEFYMEFFNGFVGNYKILCNDVGGDFYFQYPWDKNLKSFFYFSRMGEIFLRLKMKGLKKNCPEFPSGVRAVEFTNEWIAYHRIGQKLGQFDFLQRLFSFWVPLHVVFSIFFFLTLAVHIFMSLKYLVHW